MSLKVLVFVCECYLSLFQSQFSSLPSPLHYHTSLTKRYTHLIICFFENDYQIQKELFGKSFNLHPSFRFAIRPKSLEIFPLKIAICSQHSRVSLHRLIYITCIQSSRVCMYMSISSIRILLFHLLQFFFTSPSFSLLISYFRQNTGYILSNSVSRVGSLIPQSFFHNTYIPCTFKIILFTLSALHISFYIPWLDSFVSVHLILI